MKAIIKKELNSYLQNPMGYVFLAIFVLFFSSIFTYMNLYTVLSSEIAYTFSLMIYVMMVLMPLLTMRLMSEEKAEKTDQLLLSAPIKSADIVLGKFFAAMALLLIALLFTLPHVIILVSKGNPNILTLILSYVGFILYSSVYVAIGLLISSLTENQVISAVISFSIFIALLFIELLLVPSIQDPTLYNLLKGISLAKRFDDFSLGILNFASVIYYLSITFFVNFLTVKAIDKRRGL